MKLEKMRLLNFRCFSDIEIIFDSRLKFSLTISKEASPIEFCPVSLSK
jgi:hypothetical protein